MGTIVIEEYAAVGGKGSRDAPVVNLNTCLATTSDATTSTTAESITLNSGTRFVSVYAVELHRVSVLSSDGSAQYGLVPAGTIRDFAVPEGSTLYYKADA